MVFNELGINSELIKHGETTIIIIIIIIKIKVLSGTNYNNFREPPPPIITNPQLSRENFKEKEKLVTYPRWWPDTRKNCPTDHWS
jgi:hypothetical protein